MRRQVHSSRLCQDPMSQMGSAHKTKPKNTLKNESATMFFEASTEDVQHACVLGCEEGSATNKSTIHRTQSPILWIPRTPDSNLGTHQLSCLRSYMICLLLPTSHSWIFLHNFLSRFSLFLEVRLCAVRPKSTHGDEKRTTGPTACYYVALASNCL